MDREEIKRTVEQQLQLLADCSEGYIGQHNIVDVSQTMLKLAEWLYEHTQEN